MAQLRRVEEQLVGAVPLEREWCHRPDLREELEEELPGLALVRVTTEETTEVRQEDRDPLVSLVVQEQESVRVDHPVPCRPGRVHP